MTYFIYKNTKLKNYLHICSLFVKCFYYTIIRDSMPRIPGKEHIMKELMIYVANHQTDLMLFLQGICTVLAFLTLLPKNLSKRRRMAILLLEINSVLYLAANRMYFLWMSVDHSDMIFQVRAVKFLDYFFGLTMIACMNFYL